MSCIGAPSLGLFALNQNLAADRGGLARIGSLAEELGYDSLWVGEHVVVPDPRVAPSPMEPEDPILDGLITLAFLAAHTERVRLATGIVVLPQRNPVVLAKQLASLDVVTGGRLTCGRRSTASSSASRESTPIRARSSARCLW